MPFFNLRSSVGDIVSENYKKKLAVNILITASAPGRPGGWGIISVVQNTHKECLTSDTEY